MSVVKVWPIAPGLTGFDATGVEIELTPFQARWMEEKAAYAAAKENKVQIMAGLSTSQLRTADMTAEDPKQEPKAPASKPATKKRVYKRKDMAPE